MAYTKATITRAEKLKVQGDFASGICRFECAEDEALWAHTQARECNACSKVLPLDAFNYNNSGTDRYNKRGNRLRRWDCIDCSRRSGRGKTRALAHARQYGISKFAPKGTRCGICKKLPRSGRRLVFDHDHNTHRFRGYLCDPCNRGLGQLGDTKEGLLNALRYLEQPAFHPKPTRPPGIAWLSGTKKPYSTGSLRAQQEGENRTP